MNADVSEEYSVYLLWRWRQWFPSDEICALSLILRSVEYKFLTDVSGQRVGTDFKGQAVLEIWPIGRSETSGANCDSVLRKVPKGCRSHLHHCGSLKFHRKFYPVARINVAPWQKESTWIRGRYFEDTNLLRYTTESGRKDLIIVSTTIWHRFTIMQNDGGFKRSCGTTCRPGRVGVGNLQPWRLPYFSF